MTDIKSPEGPATEQAREPGLGDRLASTLNITRLVVVNEIAGTFQDVILQPDRLASEGLWKYVNRKADERASISYERHDEFLMARGLPALS